MTFFHFPGLDALFIRVRKTASTSILRGPLEGRAAVPSRHFPEPGVAGFTFAFVRHPIDRLRSAFAMFKTYPREPGDWPSDRPPSLAEMLEVADDESIDPAGDRFIDKLRLHLLPMSHPHYRLDRADFVGRYESLEADWARIARRLGLTAERLPHWRRTRPEALPELSNGELLDAHRIYGEDLERFGYRDLG